jgi:hypothetical protein
VKEEVAAEVAAEVCDGDVFDDDELAEAEAEDHPEEAVRPAPQC